MNNEMVCYTGTHWASYRMGEPAVIVGLRWVRINDAEPRACFLVRYLDGDEDLCPICDTDYYKLTPASETPGTENQ